MFPKIVTTSTPLSSRYWGLRNLKTWQVNLKSRQYSRSVTKSSVITFSRCSLTFFLINCVKQNVGKGWSGFSNTLGYLISKSRSCSSSIFRCLSLSILCRRPSTRSSLPANSSLSVIFFNPRYCQITVTIVMWIPFFLKFTVTFFEFSVLFLSSDMAMRKYSFPFFLITLNCATSPNCPQPANCLCIHVVCQVIRCLALPCFLSRFLSPPFRHLFSGLFSTISTSCHKVLLLAESILECGLSVKWGAICVNLWLP